jgi:hypothetical protein
MPAVTAGGLPSLSPAATARRTGGVPGSTDITEEIAIAATGTAIAEVAARVGVLSLTRRLQLLITDY